MLNPTTACSFLSSSVVDFYMCCYISCYVAYHNPYNTRDEISKADIRDQPEPTGVAVDRGSPLGCLPCLIWFHRLRVSDAFFRSSLLLSIYPEHTGSEVAVIV